MTRPGEQAQQIFEPGDLKRLSRSGSQVVRASNLVERAPVMVEEKRSGWDNVVLDLKLSALNNKSLTTPQKAACLATLEEARPGVKISEIAKQANELAARFQLIDTALSQSGVLVMGYRMRDTDVLFKSAGTGLRLAVYDRDEEYSYSLFANAIDEQDEKHEVLLDRCAVQNAILDPERASKFFDISGWDRWNSRLVIGIEAITEILAADKHSGLPLWKWKEARRLGFRFEELDPRLQEQYDSRRQLEVKNLVGELTRVPSGDLRPYDVIRLRERFENCVFFGATKTDIEAGFVDLFKVKQELVQSLIERVTQEEAEESPTA